MTVQSATRDSLLATAIGTAATDVTASTTRTGKPMARFRLAVDDGRQSQWLSVLCFDAATDQARTIQVGCRVQVAGRLQTSTWTGQDGKPRFGLDLIATRVDVLAPPQVAAHDDDRGFDDVPFL